METSRSGRIRTVEEDPSGGGIGKPRKRCKEGGREGGATRRSLIYIYQEPISTKLGARETSKQNKIPPLPEKTVGKRELLALGGIESSSVYRSLSLVSRRVVPLIPWEGGDPARTGAHEVPNAVRETRGFPANHSFLLHFSSSFCFGDQKPICKSNILNFPEAQPLEFSNYQPPHPKGP